MKYPRGAPRKSDSRHDATNGRTSTDEHGWGRAFDPRTKPISLRASRIYAVFKYWAINKGHNVSTAFLPVRTHHLRAFPRDFVISTRFICSRLFIWDVSVFNKGNSSVKFDLPPPSLTTIFFLHRARDHPAFFIPLYQSIRPSTFIDSVTQDAQRHPDLRTRREEFRARDGRTGRGDRSRPDMFARYIPQIIPFAENKIGLGVERRADLAESAIAASAFQAVLVPVHVQRLQQISRARKRSMAFALVGNTNVKRFNIFTRYCN